MDDRIEITGGYVSKLVFNNGDSEDIRQNDIVLFVGPNNAGKSQALKDIYALSKSEAKRVVIAAAEFSKYPGSVTKLLKRVSVEVENGIQTRYQFLNGLIHIDHDTDEWYVKRYPNHQGFRDLFVANLDTEKRLSTCTPPTTITRSAVKQHPIHYAAFDSGYRKWLSTNFKKAFGVEITPNILNGATIPLCIGQPVKLDSEAYDDEQSRQEAYAEVLDSYPQVQNQGDGIKSFTGILLYLMLNYYCTFLIDEPESFLHPPQAKIMGQIIGESLSDHQQAFISTHSEDIIKGLMETCPKRLKIIRITRDGNTNFFSVLDNEKFKEVWGDPLLKHSNIMSSLFHKTVVLCESDADCQMYSIIENHLKQMQGKYSEALFIHCGGKHRMAKVITALKALNVDVRVVPDLDTLNDEDILAGIAEACGINWDLICTDYKIIVSNLRSKDKINRSVAKATILQIIDGNTNQNLSKEEIKYIQEAVKTISKWDTIKKTGIPAIPAGDATIAFGRLNTALKSAGIHLVPVGELECFIKEVGGHGPVWVNSVLEKHPNFDDSVYQNITDFVTELDL